MTYTPFAELGWTSGRVRVPAGGLIGRAIHATLRLPQPTISEAHALLTFRDGELRLQALRGDLRVGHDSFQEIVLRRGMELWLSDDVKLTVWDLHVPTESLAFIVEGKFGVIPQLPCVVLPVDEAGGLAPDLRLGGVVVLFGLLPGTGLQLFEDEQSLWSQLPTGAPEQVRLPAQWSIGGCEVRLVAVPRSETSRTSGREKRPSLRITARLDTVHIWQGSSRAPDVVSGIPARIVSELALLGNGPVSWEIVAREIWPRDEERLPLRDKWDKALKRLREKFRALGIRQDLVRIDHHGNVEIVLHADDAIQVDTGDVPAET